MKYPIRRLRTALLALLVPLAALAFLPACASTEEPLTPEAELPEAYRRAWRAWYEESPEWPALREEVEDDPALAAFLVDNLVRVMVRFYERGALAKRGELPGPFERAQRELVRLAPYSAPVCLELVLLGDGPVAYLATDVLLAIDEPRWTLPAAERLADGDAKARRRAAKLLAQLPYAGDDEPRVMDLLERAVLDDEEWSIRLQAVEAVGARANLAPELSRARTVLCRALLDEDSTVVQTALAALSRLGDSRAVPALINLLDRVEREGRDVGSFRKAQSCLQTLTGHEEEQSAGAWRKWWAAHRPEGS